MTITKRLEQVERQLTAKQRAILRLRAWKRDEPEDWRVVRLMPANQEEEYLRLMALIDRVHIEFCEVLSSIQGWIFAAECQLAWWDSLRRREARETLLRRALKTAGVRVVEGTQRARGNVLLLEPLPVITFGLGACLFSTS